jgi:hypothetical protein
MQNNYMTLVNGLYTISLATTVNFAAKSNSEGEEETSVKID